MADRYFAIASTTVIRNRTMVPGGKPFPINEDEIEEMRKRKFKVIVANGYGEAKQIDQEPDKPQSNVSFEQARAAALEGLGDDGVPKIPEGGIPLAQPSFNTTPDVVDATKDGVTIGTSELTADDLAKALEASAMANAAEPAAKMGGTKAKTTVTGPAAPKKTAGRPAKR